MDEATTVAITDNAPIAVSEREPVAVSEQAPVAVAVREPVTVNGPTPSTEHSASALNHIDGTLIALGDGERVWREYEVTQLRRREQGQGKLYVTDSRVIFFANARGRASTRASFLIQETKLDQVTGLSAYVSRKVSVFWFLATILLGLAALFQLTQGSSTTAFVVLLVLTAGAAYPLVRGTHRRGHVGVAIHSGASQASPIEFGEVNDSQSRGLGSLARRFVSLFSAPTAFDVVVGIPADDAERVISELGALIIDLQTKGSLAAARWGVDVG
jgi:hypothetical protein